MGWLWFYEKLLKKILKINFEEISEENINNYIIYIINENEENKICFNATENNNDNIENLILDVVKNKNEHNKVNSDIEYENENLNAIKSKAEELNKLLNPLKELDI